MSFDLITIRCKDCGKLRIILPQNKNIVTRCVGCQRKQSVRAINRCNKVKQILRKRGILEGR